jgi:putative diguanylate cyclase/phosphodiesterase with PAS/PAC and GAF sensor
MKLISSDRKIILEISILGLIGAIFIFIMAFLSFNYEIEILKKSLRDEILKTDKALSYKKAEIYNKISNLSLNLVDDEDPKKSLKEFFAHQKTFNSIFFVKDKNTYRANNEKVNFFSYLNLSNFVKDLDEYGFFISRLSTIEGKKEFFIIKKLDTNSFIVAFFNSEILKDIISDNIYLLDTNGESVFNGRSFYDIYSQGLVNKELQFLKSDEGEMEFAFSLRNRDFDIEIVAHANANTILKKMIFRGIFAFLMFVVMIFLAYNCVQNFKDHYVKALNLFKRVVFTKALTKNLTTKNSDAKSIIDEILSMQSLLKRSRIDIIKANKKFDLIFENDALAYLYIDKIDGSIIFYNQAANNLFDLSRKFSIFDLKSGSYQDEIYNSFVSQNLLRDFHLTQYKINDGEYEIYAHENIWLINDEENSSLLYSILDISEHKRFVNETRRERDSFSMGPYVVINYDVVKDRVIHITKNVENLWGYSPKFFFNKDINFSYIIDEADVGRVKKELHNSHEIYLSDTKKDNFIQIYKIKHKNKQNHNYKVYVKFVSQDEATLYFYMIDDVIAQKNMLDKEITRHKNIINAASFATWEWDINNSLIHFNDNFPKIRGYSDRYFETDITFSRFMELIHKNDVEIVNKKIKNYFNGIDFKFDVEFRIAAKVGYVWTHIQGAVLEKNVNGTAKFLCGILEDISERKKSDYQMRLNASVFAYSNEGIAIMNENFIITDVNRGFERITQYKKDEIIGKKYEILNDEETNISIKENLKKDNFYRDEIYASRKDGIKFPQILTINAIQDPDNEKVHYVAIFFEIMEIKARENELRKIALHDFLTKLPNRVLFTQSVRNAVAKNSKFTTILYFDFDGFKGINDTYGHEAGDDFLRFVAVALGDVIGKMGLLARLGGDEFGAIIDKSEDKDEILHIVERLLKVGECKFDIAGAKIGASVSIGVNFYSGDDYEEAIKQADDAMYEAKTSGKNRYCIYKKDGFYKQDDERAKFEKSLQNDEFFMLYQPIIDIENYRIEGFELLLRWMHYSRGLLAPNEFLDEIKRLGLSEKFGLFVLNEGIKFGEYFNTKFGYMPNIHLNLDVECAFSHEFFKHFKDLVKKSKFNTQILVFELENLDEKSCEIFIKNRAMYDDFGVKFMMNKTEISDLNFIKKLNLDGLKTDVNLTLNATNDENSVEYLSQIALFCDQENMRVIAQGVEFNASLRLLKTLGFAFIQGNIYSPVMLIDEIEEFCARAIKNINLLDEIEFQSYEMAILHNKNLLNFINLAKKDELFKFDKTAYDDEFLRIQKRLENLKIGAKMQLHTEIYKQIFDILTRGFKDKTEQIATLKRLSKELIENV